MDYSGPSGFVHLHSHTIYSTLDGVALPQDYAEACHKHKYPAMAATEHGHMGSVPDMHFAFKKYGLKFIPGCFLPRQPVLTNTGVVAIEDIKEGCRAITDKNVPRKVLNTQVRGYDGEVVRVKAWGVEEIVSTPEHPFLIREVRRSEPKKGCWEESITLGMRPISDVFREKYHRTYATARSKDRTNKRRYRFYLCVPRLPVRDRDGYETIDVSRFTSRLQNVPQVLPLDDEFFWIAGLWLAEGTARYGELSFWLCEDEFEFYERIADYFADFGIKTSYRYRDDRRSLDVVVYSVCFADLFSKMFGTGFANKRIPWDIINLTNLDQTKALLNGLFDGDAKLQPDQSYLKLDNQSLIWQARLLLTRLGQYSAVTTIPCNNSTNLSYSIRRRESGHFYYDYDDHFIYLPVAEVQRERYKGPVYNMEVDEDNTYNVGVAVHNCEVYFCDYEPERQALTKPIKQIKADDPDYHARLTRNRHLTILAKNQIGYTNLIKLTTQATKAGFYYKPRVWFDKLLEYKEGLIVLSGCMNGPVCYELRQEKPRLESKDKRGALDWVKRFKAAFGEDYFVELQMPGVEGDLDIFYNLVLLADECGVPVIMTNDCHCLKKDDFELQTVMMAIDQGTTIDNPNLFYSNANEQYFKTRAQLWERFKTAGYDDGIANDVFEQACDNTLAVAERCEGLKVDAAPKIPTFKDADAQLAELAARKMVGRGLHKITKRYPVDGREVTYVEQLQIELERIADKGFSSYFLITHDLIRYGKRKGWPFSPRGSAGGALICLLLGISTIDPLKWGLSFDRFLSPSRGGFMLDVTLPVEKAAK